MELLDDRKLYLLSAEARCQTVLSVTFRWQAKCHVASPLPPKHHNDVILEKIVWRRPLNSTS